MHVAAAAAWKTWKVYPSDEKKVFRHTFQHSRLLCGQVVPPRPGCVSAGAPLAGPDNSSGVLTKSDDLGLFKLNSAAAGGRGIALGCVPVADHAKARLWLERSMGPRAAGNTGGWTKESIHAAVREFVERRAAEAAPLKVRGDLAPVVIRLLFNQWIGEPRMRRAAGCWLA